HPADDPGKRVLQQVFLAAQDPSFEGRIAFLEDYELHLAHRLVAGVDLWLNLPRVPLEACGTSGMKAALNGVPQLGTLDGGWTGPGGRRPRRLSGRDRDGEPRRAAALSRSPRPRRKNRTADRSVHCGKRRAAGGGALLAPGG